MKPPCLLSAQPVANFDRVAKVYRWAEYLALGPLLQWTRKSHLDRVRTCRTALVLGDGDGRFLATMLRASPAMCVVALDSSDAMLGLLRTRCAFAGKRLQVYRTDLQQAEPLPHLQATELVISHFLLDCFSQKRLEHLAFQIHSLLPEGGRWLISDFGLPRHQPWRTFASVYIRLLYGAFRLLTGLSVQYLPDFPNALSTAGFVRISRAERLGGFLFSELWEKPVSLQLVSGTQPHAAGKHLLQM